MVASDVGPVPEDCQGGREALLGRIEDLGGADTAASLTVTTSAAVQPPKYFGIADSPSLCLATPMLPIRPDSKLPIPLGTLQKRQPTQLQKAQFDVSFDWAWQTVYHPCALAGTLSVE